MKIACEENTYTKHWALTLNSVSVWHRRWRNAYAMFFFSLVAAGQTDIMTINYAVQFPGCDLSWNSESLCEWQPVEGRSRWTRRSSCPRSELATCIPLIKSFCPRSWPLLQSADLHSHTAWSCIELDSWSGKVIIAIDQREEVNRPQDKLLCCWMTSISSLVTWNNEPCWGGANGHMRIYGGPGRVLAGLLTIFSTLCVCTCTHPFQRILSEQQGDELLSVKRWGILTLRPVDLIWKHTTHATWIKNTPNTSSMWNSMACFKARHVTQ